ncbi:hypothetical protein FISHEDRAFT_7236, partial [Fistulina hepatica ATCC 64428]
PGLRGPGLTTRFFHRSIPRLTSPPPPPDGLPANASFSQRLKHLVKNYGWYAMGVYIVIGVADFSVALAAVHVFGAEHVDHLTHVVKDAAVKLIYSMPPEPGREEMDPTSASAAAAAGTGGHGSLYATIVLAYTIHKTLFLPVRVGLTAALTPPLVRWLRMRGWAGSAGTARAA